MIVAFLTRLLALLRGPLVTLCLCASVPLIVPGCAPRGDTPQPYAVGLARAEGRAGARLVVRPGTVVILDGRESGFAGGPEIAGAGAGRMVWHWRQLSGPKAPMTRADLASVECRPVAEGLCIFELTVSSGSRRSLPVLVEVEVRRDAPGPAESGAGTVADHGGDGTRPVRRNSGPTTEFALLESDLGELVRVFAARTGITLRVDPGWLRPEDFGRRPLTFMARDVPPGVALELAARLAGADFIRDGKDSAVLTAGYGWLRSARQEARFYPAPAGLVPAGGDAAGLKELLRESCRAAIFACPDSSVEWQPGLAGVNVVGPSSLHRRVRETLEALSRVEAAPPAEIGRAHV